MKKRSCVGSAFAGLAALALVAQPAGAAELRVLAANGIQSVVEDLGPKFERETGHKLSITFATGGATIKAAQSGQADVVIAPQPGVNGLIKSGRTAAENITSLATTGISVAVRKGAAKPDISSPEAFKRSIQAVNGITYLNPADGGASGIHFAKVLEQLGIAEEMKPKTKFAPKIDAVGTLLTSGEAEIAVLQYQLLFEMPGVEVVGPLPGNLQNTTVFAAAILDGTKETEASRALVKFMGSAQAQAAIRAKGMEPAKP